MKTRFGGIAVAILSLVTVLFAQYSGTQPQPRADRLPPPGNGTRAFSKIVPKPDGFMPKVPPGFAISLYAELQAPRMMVYAPNGDLFVSSPASNNITVFRDPKNNGVFEKKAVFVKGTHTMDGMTGQAPRGAARGAAAPACVPPPPFAVKGRGMIEDPFGMAFHDGYLYIGNTGSIVRYRYTNGDLEARGEPEKLIDLPVGGHTTRNIIFNRAGTKMYVTVGSGSNNDAGEDCRRATILEFNPDGSGYRIYASGLRNAVGVSLQPGTDVLWAAVNERDNYGDDLPPDFATSIKEGGFYGWPYSYIGKNYDPRYVGASPDLVNRAIIPDVLISAHSAPLGMTFYAETQFPAHYHNGAFVASHGSWNRSVAAGYKVMFFPMTNGNPGPIEDFVTGFLASDGSNGTSVRAWGRPVGVTVSRDGGLLISDDAGNRIWKVVATKSGN